MEQKLEALKKIANALNKNEVRWAVGGSALLYIKGITFSFNDLDIVVMLEDAMKAREALKEVGEFHPSNNTSKNKVFDEFVVDGVDVDVISGMAIEAFGQTNDCSFKNEGVEHIDMDGVDVVLDSLESWYNIYNLQGRVEKARYIKDYMLYHKK